MKNKSKKNLKKIIWLTPEKIKKNIFSKSKNPRKIYWTLVSDLFFPQKILKKNFYLLNTHSAASGNRRPTKECDNISVYISIPAPHKYRESQSGVCLDWK